MSGYIGSKSSVTLVDGYNQTEADAEFVAKAGDTMTGNLTFGDNDKAVFGTSADLQISHTGTYSLISEEGTGSLVISTNGNNIQLAKGATELMLVATPDADVKLYHNNVEKIATTASGIDVTGTVTASSAVNAVGFQDTQSTSGFGYLNFGDTDDANIGQIGYDHTSNYMRFQVNNAERMRIDSSGNVGIGTTTMAAYTGAGATNLVVGNNSGGSNGISIVGAPDAYSTLAFTDTAGAGDGQDHVGLIQYSHIDNSMRFFSSTNERMRIDASGNLMTVKTAVDTDAVGSELRSNGLISSTRTGAEALFLNRKSSDGNIAVFAKDGTTVGSIFSGHGGSQVGIGTNTTGITFNPSTRSMMPANPSSTNPQLDATLDIGFSSVRWKDLYLSGGVLLGGTGAANKLDDYEEGNWVPVVSGLTLVAGQTTAKYVKVGSFVFFSTQFIMPSTSSSTHMSVTGLPFLANCDSSATMGYTTSTIYNPAMMVQGITTYFYRGGGSTYVQSQYGGAYVRFSGHYNTAA